jgi:hypothetical protein
MTIQLAIFIGTSPHRNTLAAATPGDPPDPVPPDVTGQDQAEFSPQLKGGVPRTRGSRRQYKFLLCSVKLMAAG